MTDNRNNNGNRSQMGNTVPPAPPPPSGNDRTDTMEADREDRAMLDRAVTENRELSETDRLEMYRAQFSQSSLPNLPVIPGYHVCWLTTENPRDSILRRLQLGYELITPKDVPGWEFHTLKSGQFSGYIGVNEMVASKITISLYNKYMAISHHDLPREEEGKITEIADQLRDEARKKGGRLQEFDGMDEMRTSAAQQRPQHWPA
jgi:hypothetical protein